MRSLTIRSSPEWYERTAIRPPVLVCDMAESMAGANASSSPFTSIRIAWNVRFAGCPPVRRAGAGQATTIAQLGGRLDGTRRHDRVGDAACEALVAVLLQDSCQLLGRISIDDVRSSPCLGAIHPHVEGRVDADETGDLAVADFSADAEIEQCS